MKLIDKPKTVKERIQITSGRESFYIEGRDSRTSVSIHAPKTTPNDAVWNRLKNEINGDLFIGLKIESLKFGDITLYGVLPVSIDSNDVYECSIDYYTTG